MSEKIKRTFTEQQFMNRLMIEVSKPEHVRAYRQNTGKSRGMHNTAKIIKGAPDGAADLSGSFGPFGTRLEIECKVFPNAVTEVQARWGAMQEKLGGLYIVATASPMYTLDQNVAHWTDVVAERIAERRTAMYAKAVLEMAGWAMKPAEVLL